MYEDIKTYGEIEGKVPLVDKWTVVRSRSFMPGEGAPDKHCTGEEYEAQELVVVLERRIHALTANRSLVAQTE
jgi:hypothetical protein